MTNQQGAPEALTDFEHRHAIRQGYEIAASDGHITNIERNQIARELRRLHYENERLAALVDAQQPAPSAAAATEVENLRKALQFYADKDHFTIADDGAWDTVSGEPQNYWCDEEGTATVEDGTIARLALAGHQIKFDADEAPQPSPTPQADSAPLAAPADIVVLEAALRAIHQAIDLIGEPDTERLRTVRRVLRGAVVVAEDSTAPQADSQPAPQQEAQEPVAHDEDLLEQLYWDFDSQRKKTGEERLAFKGKMRSYASEFRRRSVGKMFFSQSVSDDMMNLADRLGALPYVDPIAWKHLLVYAPRPAPVRDREAVIRAAVAAMPHTNPGVADDLLGGFTMHTEADDVIAIFEAGRAARAPADSVTAPAGVEVAYLDIGAGGYLDLGTDLSNEALSRLPKGRHVLTIAGTYGIDGYTPTPPAQAAPGVLEDAALTFTSAHIDYVARYGGRCRDCADESGVCPGSGLPCADSRKAIKHVFDALEYGVKNGFIKQPIASRAKPAAALLTETCPGAPNFDGSAAYELAMNIDAARKQGGARD